MYSIICTLEWRILELYCYNKRPKMRVHPNHCNVYVLIGEYRDVLTHVWGVTKWSCIVVKSTKYFFYDEIELLNCIIQKLEDIKHWKVSCCHSIFQVSLSCFEVVERDCLYQAHQQQHEKARIFIKWQPSPMDSRICDCCR